MFLVWPSAVFFIGFASPAAVTPSAARLAASPYRRRDLHAPRAGRVPRRRNLKRSPHPYAGGGASADPARGRPQKAGSTAPSLPRRSSPPRPKERCRPCLRPCRAAASSCAGFPPPVGDCSLRMAYFEFRQTPCPPAAVALAPLSVSPRF
ncbi:hypothetical protein BS78_K164400 [Paspalum vaginatum]|uniref:Secreted protein n=1 Tax=Paspalum vaginatum TaxID=158149 RepID=A0A9W8CF18_9POAL|nr:hypothetical protein BS78_K164400 [Paspalum vaginatum]